MAQFLSTGKISWFYNWSPKAWGQFPSNIEYVPMFWGEKNAETWTSATDGINSTIARNNVSHVLGMNEYVE